MDENITYHVPVLLNQSVDGLNIGKGGNYVDVTFGGGGHSREILSRLDKNGHLYSFDQDADAENNLSPTLPRGEGDRPEGITPPWEGQCGGFTFVRSNFRYLKNFMRYYGVEQIDGLLADLGVSSHHFDDSERGFSFRFEGKLDMRMNQRAGMTAADIVNNYEEKALADVFYLYGELKNARKLASLLVNSRKTKKISTIGDFLEVIKPMFKGRKGEDIDKKEVAKVFQALRIEVNHEMDALKEMLRSATELLRPGGRLVVITYHSLEDRIVKNLMKTGNVEGREDKDFFGRVNTPYHLINNKVIVPDQEEQERNPRSRSAKLRIAEKK